jgi:hypothetical protein
LLCWPVRWWGWELAVAHAEEDGRVEEARTCNRRQRTAERHSSQGQRGRGEGRGTTRTEDTDEGW